MISGPATCACESIEDSFDSAHPGTVYWTVSFYIPAKELSTALGLKPEKAIVTPDQWRKLSLEHRCSLVLGDAIDPLFNDIADRDIQGESKEFLISAYDDPIGDASKKHIADDHEITAARHTVLDEITITFKPKADIRWVTEGRQYAATPPGLDSSRKMTLKCFWFAHYGGALSYHLSFCYRYSAMDSEASSAPLFDGYVPANYYFLSMLQKLVAPKEFPLSHEVRCSHSNGGSIIKSIFDPNTSIELLDQDMVADLSPRTSEFTRFWEGIEHRFEDDANALFRRLQATDTANIKLKNIERNDLLPNQPVIEVPGLGMPRCRFMFFFHDKRFFNRLMPVGQDGTIVDRRAMVQDGCYQPYLKRIAEIRNKTPSGHTVKLDGDYWHWITHRDEDYVKWCTEGVIKSPDGLNLHDPEIRKSAIKDGKCVLAKDHEGKLLKPEQPLRVPAYDDNRKDCIDYLFLSGFNQNIIDFMNQDTSEILDSTDPLYPDSEDQAEERFFVRFANHRALVTYVPASRSLEIGNDYIGTCPYAFLIHVLAMHNEYLDRLHEEATTNRLQQIENELRDIASEPVESEDPNEAGHHSKNNEKLVKVEITINKAKIAHYQDYQRYRYLNPFRYDTEHAVFEKLEALRGTNRKQHALQAAIANLEDYANDLSARNRQLALTVEKNLKDKEDKQRGQLSTALAILGISGLIQMIYGLISTRLQYGAGSSITLKLLSDVKVAIYAESILAGVSILFVFVMMVVLVNIAITSSTWLTKHRIAITLVIAVLLIAVISSTLQFIAR